MNEFELQVTFTGLNLFLVRADCKKVAVLQPDCRWGGLDPDHPDGDRERGVHHAGFLRFNLVNLDHGLGVHDSEGKLLEGVYRFDNEELKFEIPDAQEGLTIDTHLPAVERIAPRANLSGPLTSECGHGERALLKPVNGLFGETAPLVMRTFLTGGSLMGEGAGNWVIPSVFNPPQPAHSGNFPREVTWTRTVSGTELTLSITPFKSDGKSKLLTLRPVMVDGKPQPIRLGIANLCATNPLGWGEFGPSKPEKLDKDFKWLYRLLEPLDGKPIRELLYGLLLPVPALVQSGAGSENCIGMTMNVESFELLGHRDR